MKNVSMPPGTSSCGSVLLQIYFVNFSSCQKIIDSKAPNFEITAISYVVCNITDKGGIHGSIYGRYVKTKKTPPNPTDVIKQKENRHLIKDIVNFLSMTLCLLYLVQ